MRIPWMPSCSVRKAVRTSHNIHKGRVRGRVPRWLGPPTASVSAARGHNNSIPKPWHGRVHRSLHVNTPYPVTLHALRLVGEQHGVVAVSVIVREDGVVAPQPFHSGGLYAQ